MVDSAAGDIVETSWRSKECSQAGGEKNKSIVYIQVCRTTSVSCDNDDVNRSSAASVDEKAGRCLKMGRAKQKRL